MDAPAPPSLPPLSMLLASADVASRVATHSPLATSDSDDSDDPESTAASERTEHARQLQLARQRRFRLRQQTEATATQRRAHELWRANAALEREIVEFLAMHELRE